MTVVGDSLRDRDGKLINNWYVACLSEELEPGMLLSRTIYDQKLVLYRDNEGCAHALLDRCLHRHAQLSGGSLCGDQIRCPYHGWEYDSGGNVCRIPALDTGKPTGIRVKLKNFPVSEVDSCVWVYPGKGNPPSRHYRFCYQDSSEYGFYFMVTDFDNEVTNLVENFIDVPHTAWVHDKWFRSVKGMRIPLEISVSDGNVLVDYKNPEDSIGFSRMMLNPGREAQTHTDEFIFPNITHVNYRYGDRGAHFIITSQITPVTSMLSRVYTQIAYKTRLPAKLLKPLLSFYTKKVISQDVEIMANQKEGLDQTGATPFCHSEADRVHLAIGKLRALGRAGDQRVWSMKCRQKSEIWV